MVARQVVFYDGEQDATHVGFLINEEYIICGCCGGIIPKDEWEEQNISIVRELDWIPLDELLL